MIVPVYDNPVLPVPLVLPDVQVASLPPPALNRDPPVKKGENLNALGRQACDGRQAKTIGCDQTKS